MVLYALLTTVVVFWFGWEILVAQNKIRSLSKEVAFLEKSNRTLQELDDANLNIILRLNNELIQKDTLKGNDHIQNLQIAINNAQSQLNQLKFKTAKEVA